MKRGLKLFFQSLGIDIRRYCPTVGIAPASVDRGVGNMQSLLEDVRARGFVPRGIIDVGANRGDWTTMALEVFPDAEIIMIEPQTEMIKPLKTICEKNANVSHVLAGAGSETGELLQTIWEDLAGSSFLPSEDPILKDAGRQRLTPIVTLDAILDENIKFHPDLVKLDIQGFELEALAGGASLFNRAEMLILEVSLFPFENGQPDAGEVISYMGERGYEIYDFPGFLRRPFDGALGQVDIAFAKKAGRLRSYYGW